MFGDDTDSRTSFSHLREVVPEDIDELEHVNNAVYLRYVEAVGRAHAEREGLTVAAFKAHGVVPVIRRHTVTYYWPAVLGDTLRVSTRIIRMGGAKAERYNEVRHAGTDRLLVDVTTEWVWLDLRTSRPKRVPEGVRAAFGWRGP